MVEEWSTGMTDSGFPVIDLSPWYAGADKGEVAEAIRVACESIGFFAVRGHGMPGTTVAAMRAAARGFFALPATEKLRVARPRPEQNRAWHAEGTERLARLAGNESPPDYKEVFAIGPPDVPADPYFHEAPGAYPNYAPNLWPDRPEGFEAAWRTYWRAMEGLQETLCRIFATALGLPEDFFLRFVDRHCSMLRALYYPPQAISPLPGQLRAGAHTDLGMLTILKNEAAAGGLEVRDLAGRWHAAPVVEDGFIVNIGDLLMRWTNDRFVSTLHRVANPPAGATAGDRLSIAYFVAPNYDALIECVPTCAGPDRPAKYSPVTVAGYRNARFARTAAPGPAAA